ncbi:DNA-directed RNA polymerase I subunit RPA43-like [Haliotis asinina]|uniref:DNA-directed RNA polymerase I subunit RPA43-like n=1 Tax=Haliotis asinina TaxID=109174 RepID=UPI003531AADB
MSSISYASATDILKDPFSGFKAMTSSRQICLPPRYLGNISQGIRDQLDSEINLFCTDLESVVICYDNIKLLSSVGNIMDDMPFLHLRVQADYILFKPTLGCLLKGTVNKISKDHVGCLVHDRFNASLHRPRTHLNGWRGSLLRPGQEFPFQVEDIFSNNSVISLKGKLVDENIIAEYLKALQNNGSSPCTATKDDSSLRKDDSHVDSEGEITVDKELTLSQKRRTSSESGDFDKVDGNVCQSVHDSSKEDIRLPKSKKMKTKDKKDSHDASKNVHVKSLSQSELEPLTPVSVKKRKLNYSDPGNETVSVKKVRFDPVVVASFEKSIEKNKKRNSLDSSNISGDGTSYLVDSSFENNSGVDDVSGRSKTQKKKKKKKMKESAHDISEISGEGMSDFGDSSILDSSVNYEESELYMTERKKKKKKKKADNDISGDVESPTTKIKPKPNLLEKESCIKKEKNIHNESVSELEGESSGQENVLTGLASGLGEILSQMQSKTKKKKNSQKDLLEVMMALQNEVTKAAVRLTTPSPAERKKKKQKKKRKSEASSSSEEELDVSRDIALHKSRHTLKSDNSFVLESEASTSRLSVTQMDGNTSDRSVSESVTKKRKRDATVHMVHDDEQLLKRKKKKKLKKQHMSF